MTHNAFIDAEPSAQKLEFEGHGGGRWFGTGFVVDHADRRWIVTCWHVLEAQKTAFAGYVDAKAVRFVNPAGPTIALGGDRTILGVRIDGVQVDCAAIEIQAHEAPDVPRFLGGLTLDFVNYPQQEAITIRAKAGGPGIKITSANHYMAQGFPGTDYTAKPVTMHCIAIAELPKPYPWMIGYLPGGSGGFSGGPVISVHGSEGRLAGIHVHTYNQMLRLSGLDTETNQPIIAEVGATWGGAAPIQPLLDAMPIAGAGVRIVDVPAP
jgi:hypothetical protein